MSYSIFYDFSSHNLVPDQYHVMQGQAMPLSSVQNDSAFWSGPSLLCQGFDDSLHNTSNLLWITPFPTFKAFSSQENYYIAQLKTTVDQHDNDLIW